MFRFDFALFIVSLFLVGNLFVGDAQKIDARIDLVVIWPALDQWKFEPMRKDMLTLPDVFEIDDTKVKVAVVHNAFHKVSNPIVLPLTGNRSWYENWLKGWRGTVEFWPLGFETPFDVVRTKVFDSAVGTRARMIIVFMDLWKGLVQDGQDILAKDAASAAKLRNAAARLYVVCGQRCDDQSKIKVVEQITDDSTRFVSANSTDFYTRPVESIKKLKSIILRDLCNWIPANRTCRYSQPNQNGCTYETVFDDNGRQCAAVEPKLDVACEIRECDQECDRRWPWTRECNTTCGGNVTRSGDAPAKMEYCAIKRQCEPCPKVGVNEIDKTAKEKPFQLWIVGVVVGAVAAAIVVGVIVAIVVTKKKAAEKRDAITKKKAAALSNKEVVSTKVTPSKMHPPTTKGQSIMSTDASLAAVTARGRKGADASVVADLDASVTKQKSKMMSSKKDTKSECKIPSTEKSRKVIKK